MGKSGTARNRHGRTEEKSSAALAILAVYVAPPLLSTGIIKIIIIMF